MNTPTVIPYLPLPSEQIRGLVTAQRFDADVFESHGALNAFVRLPIDEELNDAPDALRLTLELPPMEPFRHIVKVSRVEARCAVGFDEHLDRPRAGVAGRTFGHALRSARHVTPGAALRTYRPEPVRCLLRQAEAGHRRRRIGTPDRSGRRAAAG